VNGVTYPVLSAVARVDSEGGNGWTVTISRPDPNDASSNLGLNGAVSDDAAVSFYLRSMIASSGHTMEYVGSGTNYSALPENGGVPIDANQVKELNNGKVWSAITDHKGKFSLGGFFVVDQQTGSFSVNAGAFQVDLSTLNVDLSGNAQLGAPLDMNGNELTDSAGDLQLNATGDINVQTNKITNVVDPTGDQDAATKKYVDDQDATKLSLSGGTMTGDIVFNSGQTIDGYIVQTSATGSAALPSGTELERDGSPSAGYIRFNTDVTQFEGYNGTSWASVGGGATGGGSDTWAVEHDNTITTSYTITSGKNVISAGPLTVNSGAVVTVPSGSTWVIV